MDKDFFNGETDYWHVVDNTHKLYMSEGSLLSLLDFERVLDEIDIYAFKNWIYGELVEGPTVKRYTVGCIFMWPDHLMPDPRGAKRLLPFDCQVSYRKTTIKIPVKVKSPNDFIPGTHKPKLIERGVWLVEIVMPKNLISDIRTGSIELADETIDLADLDSAYEQDLDQQEFVDEPSDEEQPQQATL